jgi:4-diphosphocytidyl-2-C-methyl-D-erythritol kinase
MTDDPFSAAFGWPAPAKLNLFLHVTGRRHDGYHLLQTWFQFLDLQDELHFRQRGDGELKLITPLDGVADEDHLVLRAARRLQTVSGVAIGADIRLHKRIPLGAGLGGGSSDAATTLIALNRLWNLGFPVDELAELGLALGADVPVFVRGQAAWAEGIGERLSPLPAAEAHYLLLLPPVQVATARIFADPGLRRDHPRLQPADIAAGRGTNDCEPVTVRHHPEVGEALRWLRQHGPAAMSGTGACCFLPLADAAEAQRLADAAPAEFRPTVARGLNRSPLAAIMRGL